MILQALKETPVDYSTHATLDSPEALSMHIAKQTNNLSAGKLYAILREAAMTAMRDALQASTIRMNYVLQALDEATSSPAILSSSAPKKPLELTKTLLLHDFGLQWEIPINRLCPPLPNRLNYLHWIEDLLGQADDTAFVAQEQDPQTAASSQTLVTGIDIGTGASCIFALLGAVQNKWQFLATEIDAESYACARENVTRNHLETLITVKRTQTNKLLLEPLHDEPPQRKFHFVMCNPPFFDNMKEADTNPESCCMGSANEMVFPGGEIAFVRQIIVESMEVQDRVLWFTSMVGRKGSLRKLLALLREEKVRRTRTVEFSQGRTKRWGLAWTFSEAVAEDQNGKVLGKRKEAQRRQKMIFRVPLRGDRGRLSICIALMRGIANEYVPSTEEYGCTSVEEVLTRIREFVDTKEGIKLIENSMDFHNGGKLEGKGRGRLLYRFEQRLSSDQNDKKTEMFCAGRVELCTRDDSESGFEVSVIYEEGDRATFWAIAQMLQVATVRTGRRWRRKLDRSKTQ
ncbi:hypothetical protein PsorP6_000945 [Peronosclerospora sorghi]|uniref:Uncharacterized protein n=1 Tax=Peronosclerospora sorghi TaxID=230839 RepID=A0ACC0WPY1_9STRA|nr:hypothetical protein PsorP6_000945 [Peronosclerospora sorghi]